jgi:hypothetical protein
VRVGSSARLCVEAELGGRIERTEAVVDAVERRSDDTGPGVPEPGWS